MKVDACRWYRTDIDRRAMKALMHRTDRHGLIQFGLYIALLTGTGAAAHFSIGSWWAVPAFAAYGAVWVMINPLVHECCHGTPFRTRWLNEAVFFIAGLLNMCDRIAVQWVHAKHHTHTQFVEHDAEIFLPAPISWWELLWEWAALGHVTTFLKWIFCHAVGRITKKVRDSAPVSEHHRIIWNCRIYLAIYAIPIVAAIAFETWWPILMFILPRFIGMPVIGSFFITQHAGMAVNVYDYRLSSRTMYLNPFFRFLYWNMNYHIEHHMFPNVPFHALPKAHELIKHDLPPSTKGLPGAFREIFRAAHRQQSDPTYVLPIRLPDSQSHQGAPAGS